MSGPFEFQLQAFKTKAVVNADAATRKILVAFSGRLIDRSPYGMPETWKRPAPAGYRPGQFRANWQMTVGTPATGTVLAVDKGGDITKARITAAVNNAAPGGVYYLTNNLPYGWALEHGWSNQAPFGMVGITVLEFNIIAAQAAAEVRAGATSIAAE
jgi:hypothetical protein